MKRLFIIFFLISTSTFSQIQKDSISKIDSITKVELKKKIKSLQSRLDSITNTEKKEEEIKKPLSVR